VESLKKLLEIMATLRSENGCPWDREQTHDSLRPYMIEEAHEVVSAIDCGNTAEMVDELGDVLLQIIFHAQIGTEAGTFTVNDVISAITNKLIRRHPHVFGETKVNDSDEVLQNWQAIKAEEKHETSADDIFKSISTALPQLVYARKSQEKAADLGFDWEKTEQVKDKVREEWQELWESINDTHGIKKVEEEFGDLLFALVNLSRFLKIQPEEALRGATRKFQRRFRQVEKQAGGRANLPGKSLAELDVIWEQVKEKERE